MVRNEHREQIAALSPTHTRKELAKIFRIAKDTVARIQKEKGVEWKRGEVGRKKK